MFFLQQKDFNESDHMFKTYLSLYDKWLISDINLNTLKSSSWNEQGMNENHDMQNNMY